MVALNAVPYIIPLFLGMTYDARTSTPGVDLFNAEYVDKPISTPSGVVESKYKVITQKSDVTSALDISGDLALKIKAGMIDVKGKGSYLKNERDFKDSVLILATLTYISSSKGLPDGSKPKDGWEEKFSTDVLGTHYVSGVTYGAEVVASAKFVVHNSSDVEEVKGSVQLNLGLEGKGVDLAANGTLDKLAKDLKGKASLEISYYGTLPLKNIPNTIEGLTELITTFADQVKEADMEDGIPMYVQLSPLGLIAPATAVDRFDYTPNTELSNAFGNFDNKLDELLNTRSALTEYARSLPYEQDGNNKKEIGEMLKQITTVLQAFYQVMWKMDSSQGPEQLEPAFKAYGGKTAARKFERMFIRLKRKIGKNVQREKDVASNTYIHWGKNECPGKDGDLLYEGFVFSGIETSVGGSSHYNCFPRNVEGAYELNDNKFRSHLAGVRYVEMDEDSNPFSGDYKDVSNKGVPCAKCHSPESASIAMFAATEECPTYWKILYKGYLMSSRDLQVPTTEYICADDTPSKPYKMDPLKENSHTLALTTVDSHGSLPSGTFPQGALIKCIVCSMTSSQISF